MKIPHTLKSATILSILVHLLFGVALGAVLVRRPPITFGDGPLIAPMVLTLRQPEKPKPDAEPVIQMVESPVEAETAPRNTDLISEVNSRAADATPTVGEQPGPAPEVIDDLATLASRSSQALPPSPPVPAIPPAEQTMAAPPPAESAPVPPAEPSALQNTPEPPAEVKPVSESSTRKTAPKATHAPPKPKETPPLPAPETARTLEDRPAAPGAAASDGDLEPFQMAKADTPPLAPEGMQDKTRGKVGDAALGEGFTSFDAIRDQIAPYLKLIKTNVERRWNEEIITRYDGHMPTEATVDCAISPEGKVISVEVVGVAKDRLYAALCKRAIERAGPFGAFPFEVPEMYRSKNLEIRWTFSFLK